jgi:ABC-type sugar transport system substrate-binding protein
MAITANELDTARRRTTGSMDALKAAGFPEKQIYQVPTKSNDIPGAFDAANSMLVQHPEVKHWLIVGMNDSTVLGAKESGGAVQTLFRTPVTQVKVEIGCVKLAVHLRVEFEKHSSGCHT